MSSAAYETDLQFPALRVPRNSHQQKQLVTLRAKLTAARAREALLKREMREQARRQEMQAQEFEHRLVNGLQSIVSLLSLQSRLATREASVQLMIAARRVAALGRVHHQLHLLDHQEHVEFRQFLVQLCDDLSSLLFQDAPGQAIVVEGVDARIPTASAIPLGFIINELVTNSAKYSRGNIAVHFEEAESGYSLSVLDDGPGLPAGFDPSKSNGLGMRIVLALVKQIGGELRIPPDDNSDRVRFMVRFGLGTRAAAEDDRSGHYATGALASAK